MKAIKYKCRECGAMSTMTHPEGAIECLACGHQAQPPYTHGRQVAPTPAITVGRYHKPDGYPTRNFAVHFDGSLLAVTVYRKGAEAVRLKFMEVLEVEATTRFEITTPQG